MVRLLRSRLCATTGMNFPKKALATAIFQTIKKTVLLVKPEHRDDADRLFSNTGINIRSIGCRYLGGSLGEQAFCEEFMKEMVQKWCQQIRTLAEIAHTQPHAAYAVFTRSVTAKWPYHIRSTASCPEVFNALDEVINTTLLPALTGRKFEQDQPERAVLALPARLGGLAVPSVAQAAERENQASRNIFKRILLTKARRKDVQKSSDISVYNTINREEVRGI